MNPEPHLLPHRFRPSSTLRFLEVIRDLQDGHGSGRQCDPTLLGMTPETFSCRLRDSVTSFLNGQTTHPSIDPIKLRTAWSRYYVTHDGKLVYVLPKGEKQPSGVALSTTTVGQPPPDAGSSGMVAVNVETPRLGEVLHALTLLLSLRLIQTRVRVQKEALPPDVKQLLTDAYDISIVDDNTHYIII